MKKWLIVVAAGLLSACSSEGEHKTYYQLPVSQQSSVSGVASSGRLLWVEQVAVPDFLAGNGIVYQTTDVQYVIAKSNLWASPLDQQLLDTLVVNLSNALAGWVISSRPLGSSQDTLNVNVTGFHGRYDGRVIVSGEWLLNHQGTLTKRPFYIQLTQHEDGYDAMVKQLALAWRQEAQEIARQLKGQP